MADIFEFDKSDTALLISELLTLLSEQKDEILDLIFLVRYQNKDMIFLHNEPEFEVKCALSKLLDYDIMSELQQDNQDEDM